MVPLRFFLLFWKTDSLCFQNTRGYNKVIRTFVLV